MLKKSPNIISIFGIHNLLDCQALIENEWVPARPIGYFSLINRLKCAWIVFIGHGDVLLWPNGQ
jgi:hypothetical protein